MDERKNTLYFYDLDTFPEEMQMMQNVFEEKEEIGVLNFSEYELRGTERKIGSFAVFIVNGKWMG